MATATATMEDIDTEVISEPSPDVLKSRIATGTAPLLIACRKDGSEACHAYYVEDEGGYAYRRLSMNQEDETPWRFMRKPDFERHFIAYSLVDWTKVENILTTCLKRADTWKARCVDAVKAMGKKSRQRLGETIASKLLET